MYESVALGGARALFPSLSLIEADGSYSASCVARIREIEICESKAGASQGERAALIRAFSCEYCIMWRAGRKLEHVDARRPRSVGRRRVVLSGGRFCALIIDSESSHLLSILPHSLFRQNRQRCPNSGSRIR